MILNNFKKYSLIRIIRSIFIMGLRRAFMSPLKRLIMRLRLRSLGSHKNLKARSKGTNINVGCGNYEIDGFISVDYYTEHYYSLIKFDRIYYDMRSDNLPFADLSIDTIYCSNVIEHIETKHVNFFFSECLRCLKSGGVLRIVCPDPVYLFHQLTNHPEYFSWHPLYRSKEDALLCFVDEVATPKLSLEGFGLSKSIFEYDYNDLLTQLRDGLKFNVDKPGHHINSWDFQRIYDIGMNLGYSAVEKSRCQGSFCEALRGKDIDLNHPEMSLYVDLQK